MALFLAFIGRDRRHGIGAYQGGRRSTDLHRQVERRVESTERRLANYQRVRLPK